MTNRLTRSFVAVTAVLAMVFTSLVAISVSPVVGTSGYSIFTQQSSDSSSINSSLAGVQAGRLFETASTAYVVPRGSDPMIARTNNFTPVNGVDIAGATGPTQIPGGVIAANGRFVTLWRGFDSKIWSSSAANLAGPWTTRSLVGNAGASQTAGSVNVVKDAAGRLIAAWYVDSTVGVRTAISTDNGLNWSAGGNLPLPAIANERGLRVSSDLPPVALAARSDGTVVAAGSAQNAKLYDFELASGATNWTAEGTVTSTAVTTPAMDVYQDDTVVVTYKDGANRDMYVRKLSAGATAWSSLPTLTPRHYSGGDTWTPSLVVNNKLKSALVMWTENRGANAGRRLKAAVLQYGAASWTELGTVMERVQDDMQPVAVEVPNPEGQYRLQIFGQEVTAEIGTKAAPAQRTFISTSTPGPPSTWAAPTGGARTATTQVIDWTAAANGGSAITQQEVSVSTSATGSFTVNSACNNVTPGALTCTATGLTPSTNYYYRVRAKNAVDWGPYSDVVGPLRTSGPPNVTTVSATDVAAQSAKLTATTNANGYSTASSFQYGLAADLSDAQTVAADPTPQTGDSPVDVTASLGNLQANTTYYYRAVGTSEMPATVNGAIKSFVTPPAPPTVSNQPATSLTDSAATLNGRINANGSTSTGYFTWGTSPTLASGNQTNTLAQSVTGNSLSDVSVNLTGLEPGTTYYYRLSADNGVGGVQNAAPISSFTTSPGEIQVSAQPATLVATTTATLNGRVAPAGNVGQAHFLLADNPSMTNATTIEATPTNVSGIAQINPAAEVSALTGNTVYYYKLVVDLGGGNSQESSAGQFRTRPLAPLAVTTTADSVTAAGANLRGSVETNGADTNVSFQYGTAADLSGTITTVAATESPVVDATGDVARSVGGLLPGTTYYFRTVANNGVGGNQFGTISSFVTGLAGVVTGTTAASNVDGTSATLNGSVNAGGRSNIAVGFQYGTDQTLTTFSTATATGSPVAGPNNQVTSAAVTGLTPGETYYFRSFADDGEGGFAYGDIVELSTAAIAPTVTTLPAADVQGASATLNGTVNAGGGAVTVKVRYGPKSTFPTGAQEVMLPESPVSGSAATPVSLTVEGLNINTEYTYQVIVTNPEFGEVVGDPVDFETLDNPTGPTGATATALDGAVLAQFEAPSSDGGSPIISYTVTASGTGATCTVFAPFNYPAGCEISGLQNGVPVTLTITATTAVGTGPSTTVAAVTPFGDPAVTTLAPSAISSSGFTMNGQANAGGAATDLVFQYGTDPDFASDPNEILASPASVTGATDTPVVAAVTGLDPGVTYYYRLVAKRDGQIVAINGRSQVVTGAATPTVQTLTPISVSGSAATLRGGVAANGASTWTSFRLSTQADMSNPVTIAATPSSVEPTATISTSASATGLLPKVTYYYQAVAGNGVGGSGDVLGSVQQFMTLGLAPTTTTQPVSNVTGVSATLHGLVNPGGMNTEIQFRYSTAWDLSNSTVVLADQSPATGNANVSASKTISGLALNTTYYYRVTASNTLGNAALATILSFTTLDVPGAPSNIAVTPSSGQATISWDAPANTGGSPITGYIVTSSGGQTCTVTAVPPDAAAESCIISGLTNGTSYTFTVVAITAVGTSVSSAASSAVVPAGSPLVNTLASLSVTPTSAQFAGVVNANGVATTNTFEYATNPEFTGATTVAASPAGTAATATTPISATVGTLQPGMTYYVRAAADNGVGGQTYGPATSFVTPAAAPTVTTTAATSVAATAATLNADVNPNGAATSVSFTYSTTSNFAVGTVFSAWAANVNGSTATPVSKALTGLLPGTTYYVRAVGANGIGASVTGAVQSFTTPAAPPGAQTQPANAVGPTSARLTSSVSANGALTSVSFRYSTNSDLSSSQTASAGTVAPNASSAPVATVSGLLPNTTYYYQVVADNGVGSPVSGAIASFTTQGPAAAPAAVNVVTGDGEATVSVTPPTSNGGTPITGYTVTAGPGGLSCTILTPFPNPLACTIEGLTNGTAYTITVTAINAAGTSPAASATATPAGPPLVTTQNRSGVTNDSATLNASVNANGQSATVTFIYGTPTDFANGTAQAVPATPGTVSGASATSVSATISGTLAPNTLYQYRASATNGIGGQVDGDLVSFVTDPNAPDADTQAAQVTGRTTAEFNAMVYPGNAQTSVAFEYWIDEPSPTIQTIAAASVSGNVSVPATVGVTGLAPGSVYKFRAKANNPAGDSTGPTLTFSTPGAPAAQTKPATSVEITTATLNGRVDANEISTNAAFQYSLNSDMSSATTVPATGSPATGTAWSAVSANLTGLSAGTLYYYRVVANNGVDAAVNGDIMSFTMQGTPSAVAGVNVVAGDGKATVTVTPPTTDGGLPVTSYTVTAGPNGQTCTIESPFPDPVACTIEGLDNGTEYTITVTANNGAGPGTGSTSTVTPTGPPIVSANTPSPVASASATLRGAVNANGTSTAVSFTYGTVADLSSGTTTVDAAQTPVTGATAAAVSAAVTGLEPGTTYYYRVNADGSGAPVASEIESFTTAAAAPIATTGDASNTQTSFASLAGVIRASGSLTQIYFEVSTSPSLAGSPIVVQAAPATATGNAEVTVGATASALEAKTTYYYRVVGENSISRTNGAIRSFMTGGKPDVTTADADAVAGETADLNGLVNAYNMSTGAHFLLSTNPTVPTDTSDSISATPINITGGTATAISAAATGLARGTTYYFRAVAQNGAGENEGIIREFTTHDDPQATTTSATASGTTGQVTGSVKAWGPATTVKIEYSEHSDMSSSIFVNTNPGTVAGFADQAVSASLPGLTPNQTYYARVVAESSEGDAAGEVKSFTVPTAESVPSLSIGFVNVPEQMVYSKRQKLAVQVTDVTRTQAFGALGATPGINGIAKLYINGKYKCQAKVINGQGSCLARISSKGAQRLRANFTGTVSGYSGSASATTLARSSASVVAITSAQIRINGCLASLTLRGSTWRARQWVKVYRASGKKWKLIAKVRSNKSGKWALRVSSPPSMVVRAAIGERFARPMSVSAKNDQSGLPESVGRAC